MDINFTEFLKNPNWTTATVLITFIIANVIIVIVNAQQHRKNGNKTVTAIDNLTLKMQVLIDKEINTVSLPNAESIIDSTLQKTEAILKDEVRRVFFYNNRKNEKRQKIIRKALNATAKTAYNDDINIFSKFYYKEKSLAVGIEGINTKDFVDILLSFIFNNGDNERDLQDAIFFIDSSFNSFITNSKSYFSSL